MEENNEQNNVIKSVGDSLKKGVKAQEKKAIKKVLKKIIAVLAPILLKLFILIVLVVIILQVLSWVLQWLNSEDSKEAKQEAIVYQYSVIPLEEEKENDKLASGYHIGVKPDTNKKGYVLNYKFLDESGANIEEEKVIDGIKEELDSLELDSSAFTESELKILAVLEKQGIEIENYTEEELKCFALFVKAEIAGQNFDLRDVSHIGEEVDIDEIRESDVVYGTLRIKKVNATAGRCIRRRIPKIHRL